MICVADESVERAIVLRLREEGYSVKSVAEEHRGIPDKEVLQIAVSAKALLITEDKDFGFLVIHQKNPSFGVLLLRLTGLRDQQKAEVVVKAFGKYGEEFLNRFNVLTEEELRIRNL